jgi:Uma2 family endonuclease
MQPTVPIRREWTVDDLHTLEDEDWRRYEIVDGALVVSPSAATAHEIASEEVRAAIRATMPMTYRVIGPVGVELDRRNYRIPDLVVAWRERLRTRPVSLRPADIVLVVEVVSPGSMTTDRITKPAQYAAAGIAHYWRVETDPISVTAYRLTPGTNTYTEVASWRGGEIARLSSPFPVQIVMDSLSPDG